MDYKKLAETVVDENKKTLLDAEGRISGVVSAIVDLTETK